MLNKTRRYMIYILVTIGFAIVGNFTSLLPSSYFWGLTFGTLGLILSVIMELYIELAIKEEPPPLQVILAEDKMRDTVKKMKEDPSCRLIQTLWCTRYGGEPEYYAEESALMQKNPRLHVRRLINLNKVERATYKEHMKSHKALLDQGKYEAKKTDIEEFECIMCEYETPSGMETKGALLFNDLAGNRPGVMLFLDPTKHEKVRYALRAIESWYKREWTRAQSISSGSKET